MENKNIKTNEEYKKMQVACKQVYTILSFYNQELLKLKIPEEVLDNLEKNSAKDYEYDITPETFDSNTLTEESSALLLILFSKYFASQAQKDKIDRFLNYQNYENYNTDALVTSKNNQVQEPKTDKIQENKQLIAYSEQNIIKRIINKIKSILSRGNKWKKNLK